MPSLGWTWSFSDWVLMFIAIGILLYIWGTRGYRRFTKGNIPHIKPLPFLGTMGSAMLRGLAFPDIILDNYRKLKNHAYGVIFMFRQPVILIRDPELIKTVTVKDFEYFTDHRIVFFDEGDRLWSKGLFSLKGQPWKDMRSTLTPAFTSSKMKTMFLLVSECSKQLVDFLQQCYQQTPEKHYNIQKNGELLVIEFKDLYTRYTNDVIATTAFGLGVDSLKHPTNTFYTMGQEATNFGSMKWFLLLSMPKLMQMMGYRLIPGKITEFFKSLVLDTIATREREGIVRPDLLQLLIQAKKGTLHEDSSAENNNRGTKKELEDEDIIAQALLFFLAGFDTTSTLLCFVSHQLATHPDTQAKLQEEIDETLKNNDGKITYEALHAMKYLDMVVSETLRIYPPGAAVDRLCVKNYTLKSDPPLEMRAGDNLFIPIFALHRDPEYFPDPDRFDPERFSDANKHKINPLTYIPFGVGPRICIGNRFALMETKLVLVHILSQFSLKVIDKTPMPIKIIQKGFNISIRGGFWMGLQQRNF